MSIPDQDPAATHNSSLMATEVKQAENPLVLESQAQSADGEPKPVPDAKLCGVCTEKKAKYKCTRCLLPYCSVACSTLHRASHPAIDTTPAPTPEADKASQPAKSSSRALAGTVGFKDPFAALENSAQLQELFKLFPKLPSQLDEIYTATLPPLDSTSAEAQSTFLPSGQRGGQRKYPEPWNRDKGTQSGIQALIKARQAYGKDGEGVREFSRLVLKIVSGEDDTAALKLVEKEIAEENARIISQLLESNS